MRRALFLIIALLSLPPAARADWGRVPGPAPGAAQVFGGAGNGCVQGAASLPLDGPGWQAIRVSRNRVWGHPSLIAYVQALAGEAQRAGLPALYIGDLSQPRGGPMSFGHASHQNGLDVDIWFTLAPKPPLPPSQREIVPLPRLVRADQRGIDPQQFRPGHVALLRAAARRAEVDRIFVHPVIKAELCRTQHGDRGWLRRLRPWRGHDEHFHVRLRCPANSPACVDGPPLPPGDGCDDGSLGWWLDEVLRPRPSPPTQPPVKPPMPPACAAILAR